MDNVVVLAGCLRKMVLNFSTGRIDVRIYDNDILQAAHHCDPILETIGMLFFTPTADFSVLSCPRCHLRVELYNLSRFRPFSQHFNELEMFLLSMSHNSWPNHGPKAL